MTSAPLQTTDLPVLLLKTRSSPGDSYEDLFSNSTTHDGSFAFAPRFVPVLLHQFQDEGMNQVRELLKSRSIGSEPGKEYGGLIFTSQRAVEGFTKLVEEGKRDSSSGEP